MAKRLRKYRTQLAYDAHGERPKGLPLTSHWRYVLEKSDEYDIAGTGRFTVRILARRRSTAQLGLDLLVESLGLVSGEYWDPGDFHALPDAVVSRIGLQGEGWDGDYASLPDRGRSLEDLHPGDLRFLAGYSPTIGEELFDAVEIAARAARRRKIRYAVAELTLSKRISGVHPHYLSSPEHIALSNRPLDHVRFAQSVVMAYKAIETLGLRVPAGPGKESKIAGGRRWNPEVRRKLERALRESGTDLSKRVRWILRGPPRKLETRHPIPRLRLLFGDMQMRDVEVEVIDAIHNVSRLRSKVAAHSTSEIQSLSVYDVANAQWLARRLMMEALGVWDGVPSP
ncbi:MAG: hypothetical protein ACYTEZ_13115 [Planctomycetota bacterium]|jgi:hypothetical protein